MAGHRREPDVWRHADHADLGDHAVRADGVPQRSAVAWPFPADWRKVKPQPLRERLAAMEDAPF